MTAVTQWPRYHIGCMPRITSSSGWAEEGRHLSAEGAIAAGKDLRCSISGCSDRDNTLRPVLYLPDTFQLARWEASGRWVGRRVVPGPNGSNVTSSIVDQVGHLNQDTISKLLYLISRGFVPSFGECFKQVSNRKGKRNTFSLRLPLSLQWLLLIHQDHILP